MKKLFTCLLDLLYPNLCVICNESLVRGEEMICFHCLHQMPKTNYHLEKDNAVEKRFWGKVPVYRATSYFHFYKGSPFRQLLHELKYRGNKEIGRVMGRFAGIDLLDTDDFASIDVIVPVPLHPKKQLKRGYNQSEWIARGLSEALNKPVDTTHLIRIKENATQTKKSVFERYQNTQGIFALNDVTVFEKKHILLVDDVLTTGSTLEACALALMESSFVKISVFTLALA
jgi:ComF family protein